MPLPQFADAKSVQGTGVSGLTLPSFPTFGKDRALFVGVGSSAPTASLTTSVVRGGSETFDELWDVTNGTDLHCSGHLFQNPSTGTATIQVTLAGTDDELGATVVSFTLAGGGAGTPSTANGTSATPSVTPAAADDELLVDATYVAHTTMTVGADQVQRAREVSIGGFASMGSSTQVGNVGDVMSWSITSNKWITGAVAIKGTADVRQVPALAVTQRM